jgi:DNA-binding NarL/FixJ family response regulator
VVILGPAGHDEVRAYHRALDQLLFSNCNQHCRNNVLMLNMISELPPTPWQLTILQLLVDGLSQKEAAVTLGIRHATIRAQLKDLRDRWEFHTLEQAVATAVKRGWVQPHVTPDQARGSS